MFGISGGAEWGGNAADPQGIFYQNVNEQAWDLKMSDMSSKNKTDVSKGNALYNINCTSCHGMDRKGSGAEIPGLINLKLSKNAIMAVLETGRGRMPSYMHLPENDRAAIISFITNTETKKQKATNYRDTTKKNNFPYIPLYADSKKKVFDPEGYPGVKPPWGTLNAIDLNTGDYLWRVPLGEFSELTKRGIPITGTENYGGPIVTAGGLVFIAGTKDERFRAFDRKTGKVIWEYQLPAGAFTTPCTYMVDGKQYIVIAAGGAKNGHKTGGNYIAFASK
ncbi:MAG: c-type cytochrome [Segetibacter sp.]